MNIVQCIVIAVCSSLRYSFRRFGRIFTEPWCEHYTISDHHLLMFLISCKLFEHGGHTNVWDGVYVLYFVILVEKTGMSMRKFCLDIGHIRTQNLFENIFIWVAQISGADMPSWLGRVQLYLFNKSRCKSREEETYLSFAHTV